jgi:tripartite ATP-independent transporter DctP family solute receptor
MRKVLAFSVLAVVLVVFAGCGEKGGDAAGGEEKLILKLGHVLPNDHPVHLAMVFMGEKMKEKSGGLIELEIFESGQLGDESDMLDQVQMGSLTMTKSSVAPMEQNVPIMGVFSVPYIFRDREHFWKVLDSDIGKEMLEAGVGAGMRGVCFYDSGSRSFYTTDKPILTPDDLVGMKIRVMKSATAMEMMNALGASPTPIPFSELYTSLSQGIVDGAENNPPTFSSTKHFEVCKHYSLDEHTMVPDILLMSEAKWKSLSDEQRRIIQESADESSVYQRELWAAATEKSLDAVKAAGIEVHYPDKAPFVAKLKDLHASYEGTPTGDLMARIQAVE